MGGISVSLKKLCRIIIALLLLLAAMKHTCDADITAKCENQFPDLATDICWDCMFPLRIGGTVVLSVGDNPDNVDTANADDFNPSEYVCSCTEDGKLYGGIWVSFWEPYAVIEATPTPYCFSFLFGMELPEMGGYGTFGTRGSEKHDENAFYNLHFYAFPLISILELIKDMDFCVNLFDEIDIAIATEFIPTWNNDELSIWTNPEAAVFGNPIAQALCAADCIASSAGCPLNTLFWCAGCWGSLYPYTGNTGTTYSPVNTTSLLSARLLALLTRTPIPPAMELDTSGTGAKCGDLGAMVRPVIKKSQYRFQMLKPIPETDRCHSLGSSTLLWGDHRNVPGTGETHSYLIWRKRNCCLRFL